MKSLLERPVFNVSEHRDEYYETSSRAIRWIVLALVLITYPFDSPSALVVLTMIVILIAYNILHYVPGIRSRPFFTSRMNSIIIDHIAVLGLVVLSGGLASPYYPLFFLLIIATIASYGIAGFAFSLSAQVIITLILLSTNLAPQPAAAEFQFIVKLILLIIFSLVAEQSVRSRDEEYLLESQFTNRVENERQRLLTLINSLSHAVLAVNSAGKVYLYNAAALELLNTNRDISDSNLSTLLPLHTAKGGHIDLFKLASSADHLVNRQDLRYRASDGSAIVLDLTVSPVHNYGDDRKASGGYMIVFRDITKEKTLDEERDEFISVTSHELRTPLAIAEANLSTALMPNFAKIEPKAKTLVEQAHTNVVFLSKLIHDLTTLSRAERNNLRVSFELIDIRELFTSLYNDYVASAKSKKLKLQTNIDDAVSAVYTSEHELREILQNFITNAIKYTPSGAITLSARSTPQGVILSVSDTGIGISASDKHKVFEKFYRSEDYRTRQTGGTGLGLYITRKLAGKLGIHIDFTSKLNHGSTFSLTIPSTQSDYPDGLPNTPPH